MFAFGHVLNKESFLFLLNLETKKARRYQNSLSLLSLTFGHLDPSLWEYPSISLKTLACLLKNELRNTDIVGQGGGNRLLFMLPYADMAGAHNVRERSQKILNFYGFGRNEFPIEIGEVCFPTHAKDINDLISMSRIVELEQSETGHKWAEEALRQSGQRWRSLVQNIPDIILVVARNGTILVVNRTISGTTAESMIGKSVYDNVAPEHCETLRKSLQQVFQTGTPDTFEILGVGPHGLNTAWYETRVVPNKRNGQITSVTLISTEITERKRGEEKIRDHEERFRQLVEDLYNIVIYRYRFTPIRGFEYISPAVTDITGYPPEELCGDPNLGFKLMHPDDRHLFEAMEKGDEAPGIPFNLRWVRKDGTTVWTEQRNIPIYDAGGTLVGVEGIAREIAEQKRKEMLEQPITEFVHSNAELENLVNVTSQEMDEPLHMVARCANLLERRYKGRLDSNTEKIIGYAIDGVNRMRRLVNDLIAYSRISSEGRDFAPTNCETAFNRAILNLREIIEENDVAVSHDPLPSVMGDESQLIQLFQNLIGNAIKFRGEDPLGVHVSVEKKEHEWLFSVQDNGIGIDSENFERIFMIFQRLPSDADYPGTGIGLAICKKIVERHRGHIWVDSEFGKGSTFYFTIPMTMIGEIDNHEERNHREA